jgi:hypothetical protein
MEFEFWEKADRAGFALQPEDSITVVTMILARLMERQEAKVTEGLQTFAIRQIEANTSPDGRPYLVYVLENGLGFGSGLERDKLETLYRQLGEVLGAPPPKEESAAVH